MSTGDVGNNFVDTGPCVLCIKIAVYNESIESSGIQEPLDK
jgi:hypothetical protein